MSLKSLWCAWITCVLLYVLCLQIDGFTRQTNNDRMTVQVHYDRERSHWVTSARLPGSSSVTVYDSLLSSYQLVPPLTVSLKRQLDLIYGPQCTIYFPRVSQQGNAYDCGLYAIAFATDACFGKDISSITYVNSRRDMRQHLYCCMLQNSIVSFPSVLS